MDLPKTLLIPRSGSWLPSAEVQTPELVQRKDFDFARAAAPWFMTTISLGKRIKSKKKEARNFRKENLFSGLWTISCHFLKSICWRSSVHGFRSGYSPVAIRWRQSNGVARLNSAFYIFPPTRHRDTGDVPVNWISGFSWAPLAVVTTIMAVGALRMNGLKWSIAFHMKAHSAN